MSSRSGSTASCHIVIKIVKALQGSPAGSNYTEKFAGLMYSAFRITCVCVKTSLRASLTCSLWGESKNGRLALEAGGPRDLRATLLSRSGGLHVPARLAFETPIVDLVAGGWWALHIDCMLLLGHWRFMDTK